MEKGGIEEHRVALRERELDMMRLEIVAKLRPPRRHVARQVALREWQVERRARLERHVAMGDRALQRQHGRETMHMGGIALDRLRRLKAEMVIAMRKLRRAARIDDVELRGDLISGAKPRLAHERNDGVAVIGGECRRVPQAQLLERVPD